MCTLALEPMSKKVVPSPEMDVQCTDTVAGRAPVRCCNDDGSCGVSVCAAGDGGGIWLSLRLPDVAKLSSAGTPLPAAIAMPCGDGGGCWLRRRTWSDTP